MKKAVLLLALLVTSLILANKPTSYLMPNTQVFLTPEMNDGTRAFYLSGVLGPKNYQGIATFGTDLGEWQRFKITGDYLTQKLRYDFDIGGDRQKWVHQAGVGAAYQYIFDYTFFKTIDAGLSFSHARSRSFQDELLLSGNTLKRRIAGSDALLSYLGVTLNPWHCGYLSLAMNYDHVKYNRRLESKKRAIGFGGSVNYTQQMGRAFVLEFDADIRRPFQLYQSTFSWDKEFSKGQLTLGAFGSYTVGNKQLPNVAAAGLQIGFAFGSNCPDPEGKRCDYTRCHDRFFCDIGQWVLDPPLLPPIVLAIPDEAIVAPVVCPAVCCQPTIAHQIPDRIISSAVILGPLPVDIFNFCSTYALTVTPDLGNITIDPATGIITYVDIGTNTYELTVTGMTSCGSATQSFTFTQQ